MTALNYAASEQLVLAHEGGYVNNAKDPGGPTNKGITQKAYDRYRKSVWKASQSVKLIADDEVAAIYKNDYWNMVDCDEMPIGIDYALFDYCVNSGPAQAVKDLQRCINDNANFYGVSGQLLVDGLVGNSTIDATKTAMLHGSDDLIASYCEKRLSFMKSLTTWKTFGTGWQRRVEGAHDGAQDDDDGVVDLAIKMTKVTMPLVVVQTPAQAAANPAPEGQPVIIAPSPIGARTGEAGTAKALPAQVALIRTAQGAGAALAAAGVTGNTAIDAAKAVRGHMDGSILGQLALILFVLLMLSGVGLILYKFFHDRSEKKAS